MLKKCFTFFWIIACLFGLSMQSAYADSSPKQKVETFLSGLMAGKIISAYDALLKDSDIPKKFPQGVFELKKQTETLLPLNGKLLGYEQLASKQYGKSVQRYDYLLKSENGLTVWEFYFYKPHNQWLVEKVNFSQDVSDIPEL